MNKNFISDLLNLFLKFYIFGQLLSSMYLNSVMGVLIYIKILLNY